MINMSKEAEKRLDGLQSWYLRILLRQGQGAPSSAMLWEFSVLSMGRGVWREKLSLGLHISRLGEDTLANKVWREQELYEWPGLFMECMEISEQLGVEAVKDTVLGAHEYRKTVTKACHAYDARMLMEQMQEKTKCSKILAEGYGRKEYSMRLTPHEVREYFATRVQMIAIARNYSRDNRFRRTGWLCLCGEREEQEHILKHCQKYEDIRQKYEDFEDDDSLVRFFREVLERRDKVREEEQKEEKRRKQGAGEGEEE